jgi:K+-transporting ATPase A subunit
MGSSGYEWRRLVRAGGVGVGVRVFVVRVVAWGEVLAVTFLGWLTGVAVPLGSYMAAVYSGERTFLDRLFGTPERLIYKVMRVDPHKGQDWKAYAKSLIIFGATAPSVGGVKDLAR